MARLSAHAAGATLNLKDRTRLADAIAALGPIDNLVVGGSADVAWGPFNTLKMDAVRAALNMKLIGYLAAAQAALTSLRPSAVRSPSSVVSKFFRTFDQATASVCMTCGCIERPHVHVALSGPCRAGDVAQPRGRQVEA